MPQRELYAIAIRPGLWFSWKHVDLKTTDFYEADVYCSYDKARDELSHVHKRHPTATILPLTCRVKE